MSAETATTEGSRPSTAGAERAPGGLRALAMAAVCVGLAALAGGTFVLSYSGIHALALHAGITPRLARGYPLLIDAMLVIVLAAVLALRGADLPSRLLAWTTLLAVLAAAAAADALHAAGHRLPKHVAAIVAAVLPWALLFLAFALLLAMLRHARLRKLAATRSWMQAPQGDPMAWSLSQGQHEDAQAGATSAASIVPGLGVRVRQPHPAPALRLRPERDAGPSDPLVRQVLAATADPELEQPELAVDAEPGADDPTSDEAAPEPAFQPDQDRAGQDKPDEAEQTGEPGEQPEDAAEHDELDSPDMPVFHRMWSSPTPPEPQA